MTSAAVAIAAPLDCSLPTTETPGFEFPDMRIFDTIPIHDDYDVVAVRGAVAVLDRVIVRREGVLDGSFYVRESQRTPACMPWDDWHRRELEDQSHGVRLRSRLKIRREVVRAIRWPHGDCWALRLASGFVDGPYHDWAFGSDLIGKVVGIYRPI